MSGKSSLHFLAALAGDFEEEQALLVTYDILIQKKVGGGLEDPVPILRFRERPTSLLFLFPPIFSGRETTSSALLPHQCQLIFYTSDDFMFEMTSI